MERVFHQNKLNPGDDETTAEFSWNCFVPLKFVEDYVDHLAQIKMPKEKQSQELKVKDSKHSSWSKVITTLNERNTRNTVSG